MISCLYAGNEVSDDCGPIYDLCMTVTHIAEGEKNKKTKIQKEMKVCVCDIVNKWKADICCV